MVSSVMLRLRWTAHSSGCSSRRTPIRRVMTASTKLPMGQAAGRWPSTIGAIGRRLRRDTEDQLDRVTVDLDPTTRLRTISRLSCLSSSSSRP